VPGVNFSSGNGTLHSHSDDENRMAPARCNIYRHRGSASAFHLQKHPPEKWTLDRACALSGRYPNVFPIALDSAFCLIPEHAALFRYLYFKSLWFSRPSKYIFIYPREKCRSERSSLSNPYLVGLSTKLATKLLHLIPLGSHFCLFLLLFVTAFLIRLFIARREPCG